MKKIVISAVALSAIMGSVNCVSASEGVSILSDTKVKGEIRPRFEMADVKDNKKDPAKSFTNRLHLSAQSNLLSVEGLTTTLGVQSVNNFGYTNYNSTANNQVTYDVIKDPNFAMLSEASIDYKTGKTSVHAGRSQLNIDNQRFIGTVGWRQVERSYDTVMVSNQDVENLTLTAAYVDGFQGVGAGVTTDSNSIILHGKYKVMDELSVTAYDYMLAGMHDTMGVAFTGKVKAGAKLSYRAEYAMQKDATMDNGSKKDVKADASYYNLDLGANISGIIAGVNYEVLSGADKNGKTTFTPALGTNHKFNGWADVFYVASKPAGGLKDANVRLGYKAKGIGKILGVYHKFNADVAMAAASGTTDDLGSEIDAVYVNAIPGVKGLKGLVKLAMYSKGEATGYTNDKQVAWVQLDYKF